MKPTNLSIQFPTKKITYNLKGKKRWVWIGATEGANPETKEEGFIVVATQENSRRPINPSSCYVLTNKIYVTKEKALIDGASHIGGWLKNFSK